MNWGDDSRVEFMESISGRDGVSGYVAGEDVEKRVQRNDFFHLLSTLKVLRAGDVPQNVWKHVANQSTQLQNLALSGLESDFNNNTRPFRKAKHVTSMMLCEWGIVKLTGSACPKYLTTLQIQCVNRLDVRIRHTNTLRYVMLGCSPFYQECTVQLVAPRLVSLTATNISFLPASYIKKAKRLRVYNLHNCLGDLTLHQKEETDVPRCLFVSQPNGTLKTLALANCKLVEFPLCIQNLCNLRYLNLRNNRITYVDANQKLTPHLNVIMLDRNPIKHLSKDIRWPRYLRTLSVLGVPLREPVFCLDPFHIVHHDTVMVESKYMVDSCALRVGVCAKSCVPLRNFPTLIELAYQSLSRADKSNPILHDTARFYSITSQITRYGDCYTCRRRLPTGLLMLYVMELKHPSFPLRYWVSCRQCRDLRQRIN